MLLKLVFILEVKPPVFGSAKDKTLPPPYKFINWFERVLMDEFVSSLNYGFISKLLPKLLFEDLAKPKASDALISILCDF